MQEQPTFKYVPVDDNKEAVLAALYLAYTTSLHVDDPEFALERFYLDKIKEIKAESEVQYRFRRKRDKVNICFAYLSTDDTSDSKSHPIGICVKHDRTFSFFVRPEFRRLGIGSALLKLMRELYGDRRCSAQEGRPGSVEFFNKNHLSHIVFDSGKFVIYEHFRVRKHVNDDDNH